jgi:ABC-2 type transport system ATP-binding protein
MNLKKIPMKKNSVLEIKNLNKNYGRIKAVQQLSIQVDEGQVFGLLGPNGSGKTTTLSIISGLLNANSGQYYWFGQEPSAALRKRVGSLIEIPHFYPYLNLEKNLSIIAKIKGQGENDISRVLDEVDLSNRRKSRFSNLSLGMKQRLGIAAALLGDPDVLVLDEPTNGLDPEGIAEVRDLITQQSIRGKTILMASHILSEVEKVCTHVAILKNGKLLEQGDVRSLIKGENLIEISSVDLTKLKNVAEKCEFISWIKEQNGSLMVGLGSNKNSGDLNQYFFSSGIHLTSLINHTKSLESQFLELVKETSE